MSDNALIIFAKAAERTLVKTRLASVLNDEQRVNLYKWLLEKTINELSHSKYYTSFICFNPPDRVALFERYNLACFPQMEGELGFRMRSAFEDIFKMGYRTAILVGVDIPDLTRELVEEGFDRLKNIDIVLGPAEDGGYYLVGMNTPVKDIFSGVRWSTEETLSDTMKKIQALCLSVSLLKTLKDIDRPEDLNYLKERYKLNWL